MVALRGDRLLKFNFMTKKSKGLGDSIEKFTEATGIKKLADKIPGGCGCEKRKQTFRKSKKRDQDNRK